MYETTRRENPESHAIHPIRSAHPDHVGDPTEAAMRALGPAGRDLSLVDVVLLACELSEDASEVDDVVDAVIRRGAARILPLEEDAMLTREDGEARSVAA